MENGQLNFEGLLTPFFYTHKNSSVFFDNIKTQINEKVVIVTDDNVKKLYLDNLIKNLDLNINKTLILSSPSGEQSKSINIVLSYIDTLCKWGVDRSCLVICFGGGIPGNMGGLLAGLMFRGINFIHIPTTILAAFDSVVSLKQAVNSDFAKNSIGLYHKAAAVYSSGEYFSTLSSREIRSGVCETIKNALAILPYSIPILNDKLNDVLDLKEDALKLVKDISIEAKQKVMLHDKFEKKKALILEYGHTIGHAIELIDSMKREDSIPHGEAVGLGMLVEAEISHKMGYLSKKDLDIHYDILSKVNIIPKFPSNIAIDEIIKFTMKDNKRGYIPADETQVGMILLKELGCVNGDENLPITAVPIKIIEEILIKFKPNY